jgi:NarL family two-component system response regulator LiaR
MSDGKSDQITTIIVDDHAIVRQGIRAFLDTQPDILVISEASSGDIAIQLCLEHVPDVVLMDLVMSGMDGVEATRQIKQVSPRTQVIILTSYHNSENILPAIRAGALSYLLKDVNPSELVDAVRRAAQGDVVLHPRIAAQMMQLLHNENSTEQDDLTPLSKREIEVLHLLAEGLSNAAIAQQLQISEKTVKSHVSNILSKLHLADRTQAAVYAWRSGLIKLKK